MLADAGLTEDASVFSPTPPTFTPPANAMPRRFAPFSRKEVRPACVEDELRRHPRRIETSRGAPVIWKVRDRLRGLAEPARAVRPAPTTLRYARRDSVAGLRQASRCA